jgi:hypothetical protein
LWYLYYKIVRFLLISPRFATRRNAGTLAQIYLWPQIGLTKGDLPRQNKNNTGEGIRTPNTQFGKLQRLPVASPRHWPLHVGSFLAVGCWRVGVFSFESVGLVFQLEQASTSVDLKRRHKTILEEERPCERFFQYVQGFSPKEHREMMHEEIFRKQQEEQRRTDAEWRAAQDDKRRAWEKTQKEDERKYQKTEKWKDRWWNIFIAVVAFVSGLFFNHYVIEKGWKSNSTKTEESFPTTYPSSRKG